jgi:P-type Cu2+ transporter
MTQAAPTTTSWSWGADHRGPLTVDDDFASLDDSVEQSAFTQIGVATAPDGSTRAQACSILVVQGMYCAACADAVSAAVEQVPGIEGVQVNAATRRITVWWDPANTTVSQWAKAVGDKGYRLLPARDALSLTERMQASRRALWRLFVAGFCTMQVMMYAWPDYVAEPGDIPPDIEQLLRWASLVLTLPVMVFAAQTFFTAAWRDAKQWRVGMDTPVSIGIAVAFAASVAATLQPDGPWGAQVWFDSLTMFVFFLLASRYWELKARDRTAGALDAIAHRLPDSVLVESQTGELQRISSRNVRLEHVLHVAVGQALPADGVLLNTQATTDEALLTGESKPVHKAQGDTLVAGSLNVGQPLRMRVTQLGSNTRFAHIVALMERAATDKPRLAQLADRVAAPFLVVVLLLATATGLYWWTQTPSQALAIAVSVLIVTCPCALSLATPTAMLATAGRLAGKGVLLRRLQALEALSGATTVVFDKTGTLTKDQLQVQQLHLQRPLQQPPASQWTREHVLAAAQVLAGASMHPSSKAVVRFTAGSRSDTALACQDLAEHAGLGVQATIDAHVWRLGSSQFVGGDWTQLSVWDGPRVFVSCDSVGVAHFDLTESVRDDAAQALQALADQGLNLRLLSGDQPGAVQAVAGALSQGASWEWASVVAAASPQAKLDAIRGWQAAGERVVMVGDGINDAPVLAQADASFTLGQAAALVQNRADLVIQGAQLAHVAATRELARVTMRVVKQNLAWALAYNVVAVPLAVAGLLAPWAAGLGMAASSLVVVGNAMRLSAKG